MNVTVVRKFLLLMLALLLLCVPACGDKGQKSGEIPALEDLDLDEYMEVGDYTALKIETAKRAVVTDEVVEQQVMLARSNYADYREKTTAAAMTDQIIMDYVGKIDGKEFAGGSAQDADVTLGSGMYIDGFESGLVGHKTGEKVTLNLKFPADYGGEVAGKDVVFEVTIKHVYELTLPEYTDAFVKEKYGFGTIKAFEAEIRSNLEQRYDSAYRSTLEENVVAALMEITTFKKFPEEEYNQRYTEYVNYYTRIAESNDANLNEYIGIALNMSVSEFYDRVNYEISRYMQQKMLVTYIAKKENLSISAEEYRTGALTFARSQGFDTVEEVESYFDKDEIKLDLLFGKVVDFILETATVTEK